MLHSKRKLKIIWNFVYLTDSPHQLCSACAWLKLYFLYFFPKYEFKIIMFFYFLLCSAEFFSYIYLYFNYINQFLLFANSVFLVCTFAVFLFLFHLQFILFDFSIILWLNLVQIYGTASSWVSKIQDHKSFIIFCIVTTAADTANAIPIAPILIGNAIWWKPN